jgi:chromate transporter
MNHTETATADLKEIALAFLKLGSTAFGGPAAHLAMMEEQFVRRKKWIHHDELLDLIGAANLIPGPNSTEVAIHIGYKLAGWRGLWVAGISFILPAFLMVWMTAWFYVTYSSLPALQALFGAIKPVIIAIIAQAVWNLSKTALKDRALVILAGLSILLFYLGSQEILILFLVAAVNAVWHLQNQMGKGRFLGAAVFIPSEKIFLFFAKVGSVLFGSGYVLIAFLQNDLVDRLHWITQQQLLDAIAVGQFTPGPVFTTATFIGYLLGGHGGALLATVGIFLPAFIFVILSAPWIQRMRQSKWSAPILDGLNVASLSLMAASGFLLARSSLLSLYGLLAFIVSFVVLIRFKINSLWLILTAGLFGLLRLTS